MGFSAVLRRPAASGILSVVVAGFLAAAPSVTLAASCGDGAGGARVPCECGDDVVSSTTLEATDPVVSAPCPGDGLVIAVPAGEKGITLNLSGLSIVGSGRGVGIRVVRGGTEGSTIIGGGPGDPVAEIANFRTGISANGRNDLVELSGLYVHDNVRDGLHLHTSGVRVVNVMTENNGRDGVVASGHGLEISGVVSEGNRRDGVQIRGTGANVSVETRGNSQNGLVISGIQNRVETSSSRENGGIGIVTSGRDIAVGGIDVGDNAGGDVKDRANAISGGAQ